MRRIWQLLATFVLVAALATSGYAGSGSGKGGNKSGRAKKEQRKSGKKHSVTSTTLVGQVIASDDRILDLTGDYTLSGSVAEPEPGVASLALSIVQDDRGRLAGNSVLTLPDGTTTEVPVMGELNLSGRRGSELSFRVAGSLGDDEDDDEWDHDDKWWDEDDDDDSDRRARTNRRDDDDDDDDDSFGQHDDDDGDDDRDDDKDDDERDDDDDDDWDDDDSDDDDDDMTTSVRVRGHWDGTAFDTHVAITVGDDTYRFETTLLPVNPLHEIVIEPPTETTRRGKVTFSERTVLLPWGTETGQALEVSSRRGFKFMMRDGDFGIDLRGDTDTSATMTVERARVRLGYGSFELAPENVSIVPIVQ